MRTGRKQRGRGRKPRLLACLIMLVGALAMPAGSAAASKWTVRALPERQVLNAVSCPSESLCVAVGAIDTVAFSQAPTGGLDRWHVVNPMYDEPRQSCLEKGEPASFCIQPRGSLGAVSCPTESLCVAVGYEGSAFVSTDPTGAASAWSVIDLKAEGRPGHLTAVSCPSASLCVAVSGGYGGAAGRVLSSTDPASGQWQTAQLGGAPDLQGVSCATPALCVAVAKEGRIFVSTDPTAGASAWREAGSPTPRDLFAVSCAATLLCAAGDAGGNVLTTTDPIGGGFAAANADGSVQITGLTCPATNRCVAVTNNADVLTSTDPTGGPGAWSFENLVPFEAEGTGAGTFVGNALFGASCASISLCALVGANSRIFTATDPFAAPVPGGGDADKRTRRRPRTVLVFAEGFWKSSITRHRRIKARFRFYSRDGARGFLCKPDRGRWRRCHSPLRYWAPVGRHVLRVRAIGRTGLRGPATSLRFEVERPRRRS
jgi:hypothetical protein